MKYKKLWVFLLFIHKFIKECKDKYTDRFKNTRKGNKINEN